MISDSTNPIAAWRALSGAGTNSRAISNPVAAMDTVTGLLDLTHTPRPITGALESIDNADAKDSFSLLAKLLQQGVVGTETYDVNGRPYTRFIETTIGDRRLDGLKPYLDRRA